MQMPEVLEGYYVRPVGAGYVMLYISTHKVFRGLLKTVWPTLSKGTQENIMKLAIIMAMGPRADNVDVKGIGYLYIEGGMHVFIVPKEPDHADA